VHPPLGIFQNLTGPNLTHLIVEQVAVRAVPILHVFGMVARLAALRASDRRLGIHQLFLSTLRTMIQRRYGGDMEAISSMRANTATKTKDSDYEPMKDSESTESEQKKKTDHISLSRNSVEEDDRSMREYKAEQRSKDRELAECVRDIARQEKEKKWLIVSFFLFIPALAGLGWLIYHITTKQSSKMQPSASS
jgi:hypothetical protein